MTEHIRPDLMPHLDWGDPLPLIWHRAQAGLWHVWLPASFTTSSPDGVVRWSRDVRTRTYSPEQSYEPFLPKPKPGKISSKARPFTEWGGPLPTEWISCPDGRCFLSPNTLQVRVGLVEVYFKADPAQPMRLVPWDACNLPLPTGKRGVARLSGGPYGKAMEGSDWRRTIPGDTWWPGTMMVEPNGVEFIDAPDLLPLVLPDRTMIEKDAQDCLNADKGERTCRSYLLLTHDLSGSERFMQRVGEDMFARHFFTITRDNDLIFEAEQSYVLFKSERRICHLLAILRRYGESYVDVYMAGFFCELTPEIEKEVAGLLQEVGYTLEPN